MFIRLLIEGWIQNKYMLIRIVPLLLLLMSCEWLDDQLTIQDLYDPENRTLELWCDLEKDGEVYLFEYDRTNNNDYGQVHFRTQVRERVFWYSPNQWFTIMFNDTIWSPSIQYSTYGRDTDGTGLQNFYVSPQFLGDTLYLYGYLDEDNVEMVKIFVK